MSIKEKDKLDRMAYMEKEDVRNVVENGKVNISRYTGIGNKDTREINAVYNSSESEKVWTGPSNALIIIGKDRNAGKSSGYGGKGYTGCAAIDLVAGFMGPRPVQSNFGTTVMSNKDFKNDAARVYISQMADVDDYFGIPKMQINMGPSDPIILDNSVSTSCVGIKADNVRLIARESVKIVTFHGGFNTLARRSSNAGVDIIAGVNVAGNGADPFLEVQPMVKGNNLLEFLKELVRRIEDTQATVATFLETQRKINRVMMLHKHPCNRAGLPSFIIIGPNGLPEDLFYLIDTLPDIIQNNMSFATLDATYFNALSPKYINSIWNKVN